MRTPSMLRRPLLTALAILSACAPAAPSRTGRALTPAQLAAQDGGIPPTALNALAAQLDKDAAASPESARVQALSGVVKGLAK